MDLVTYALCKKLISGVASGITNIQVVDQDLILTGADGQEYTISFPTPKDGNSITKVTVNEEGHLICEMSDGDTIDAGQLPVVKGAKGDPFTYDDFTPEQLEGLKPKKGVDYFTQEDIQEIINQVEVGGDYLTRAESGDIKDLTTENKDNLVAAINELQTKTSQFDLSWKVLK